MERSLFSPRWYRVAALRPQLRPHVELKRQLQRGVPWFVLLDSSSDRMQRLNAVAYQFVGRCDGRFTVQQIWDELLAAMPDDALTQDEVVQLLIQLHERGLVQFDVAPDIETLFRVQDNQRGAARRRGVNPLAFRISLGDPSRLLARFDRITPRLFSGMALLLWLGAVLAAGIAAALHWPELRPYAHKTLASPRYLLMTWLAYPLIKLVHELAHGLAVRRWGGTVRQAGVMLFMLTPVPFVNASAADGFRHRHQRAVVSGAGIAAELLLAALATAVWLAVQPSLVRDLAFIVMLIGGVSTVLANGNPLMRFDGYFFFCDALDLRNLAGRSGRWWQQLIATRSLGLRSSAGALEPLPGERFWLVAYAPLAWCYRIALALGITLWLGSFSAVLGVVAGATMLLTSLGQPLKNLWHSARRRGSDAERGRVARRGMAWLAAAALLVTLVPLPFNTVAEGVVWLPERAQVRARTEGFITHIGVADGARVKTGEVLGALADDRLAADHVSRLAEATDLEIQLFDAMSSDPQHAPALRERLAFARAEAARVEQKMDDLQLRAEADGVLVMPHGGDLPGSFRKQGDLLGYVLTEDPLIVRVALPQQDAALVRRERSTVSVRLAEEDHRRALAGEVRHDTPQAAARLPSAALGDRGGGRIATDGDDKDGLKPQTAVVVMDVAVPSVRGQRIGARALVRFDHGWMPLGGQVVRKVQQLVLQHFNPGA